MCKSVKKGIWKVIKYLFVFLNNLTTIELRITTEKSCVAFSFSKKKKISNIKKCAEVIKMERKTSFKQQQWCEQLYETMQHVQIYLKDFWTNKKDSWISNFMWKVEGFL